MPEPIDTPHTGDDDLLDALTDARVALEEPPDDSIEQGVIEALEALTRADAIRVHELATNSHADLLAALKGVVEAARLPPVCPHDSEPDICDGCAFARENAGWAALTIACAAIAKAEGR